MAKIVTIRMIVEDDFVKDLVESMTEVIATAETDVILDDVIETHPLPKFIEDSIVNETYVKGEFNKPIIVGYMTDYSDPSKNEIKFAGDRTSSGGCEEANEYKYDTLPSVKDYPHQEYAPTK